MEEASKGITRTHIMSTRTTRPMVTGIVTIRSTKGNNTSQSLAQSLEQADSTTLTLDRVALTTTCLTHRMESITLVNLQEEVTK
jgi:hypothetical protein